MHNRAEIPTQDLWPKSLFTSQHCFGFLHLQKWRSYYSFKLWRRLNKTYEMHGPTAWPQQNWLVSTKFWFSDLSWRLGRLYFPDSLHLGAVMWLVLASGSQHIRGSLPSSMLFSPDARSRETMCSRWWSCNDEASVSLGLWATIRTGPLPTHDGNKSLVQLLGLDSKFFTEIYLGPSGPKYWVLGS